MAPRFAATFYERASQSARRARSAETAPTQRFFSEFGKAAVTLRFFGGNAVPRSVSRNAHQRMNTGLLSPRCEDDGDVSRALALRRPVTYRMPQLVGAMGVLMTQSRPGLAVLTL